MSSPQSSLKITFRCSSLGALMSNGRGSTLTEKVAKKRQEIAAQSAKIQADIDSGKTHLKTAIARVEKLKALESDLAFLEAEDAAQSATNALGDSAKSICRNIVLRDIYGALEEHESDATRHGKLYEPAAIAQWGELMGVNRPNEHLQFRKNLVRETKQFGTEDAPYYLTGEPDVIFGGTIWEFKCPFSIPSFEEQVNKMVADYYLQVQGYMLLFDLEKAAIITALFKNKNITSDAVFENTPRALRFHTHEIERDEDTIAAIIDRLAVCADYTRAYADAYRTNRGFYLYKKYRDMYSI